MMRAVASHIPKSAAALFAVAAFLAVGQIRDGGEANALPDPRRMAAVAEQRDSTAEIVDFWQGKAAGQPDTAAFHTQHAAALLALASETGDLTLYESADAVAAEAVAIDPHDATAILTLAAARAGQHDFRGALALIDDVLADDPESVPALLAAGDALLELGDEPEAEEAYRAATALLGGQPPALLSRQARLESARGDSPRALGLARVALIGAGDQDLPPADAAFYWLQLAHYQFRTGEIDAAAASARSALVVDDGNLGATELLARIVAAQGHDAEAIRLYEDLLERGPAADLHGELAEILVRQGRDAEAAMQVRAGLRLALEAADRFPAERRHLIGFLADHRPDEALRLAQLDLETRRDVAAHAWYAWALHRTGQDEAAFAALQPVLEAGVDDPWMLYQAGTILAASGDHVAAAALLAQALEINPVFDVAHAPVARALLAETAAATE